MGLRPGQKALCGAGRQKGTPNRDKQEVRDIFNKIALAHNGWNPIEAMAQIGRTGLVPMFDPKTHEPMLDDSGHQVYEKVETKTRCRMLEESSSYAYAKRKSVEHEDGEGNPLESGLVIEMVRVKKVVQ